MTPELLQALTAAKGLPMPIEEGIHVDRLADLFRREKRLRDMLRRLRDRAAAGSQDAPAPTPMDLEAAYAVQKLLQHGRAYFDQTATGKNTKSMRPVEWTHAECAQACQGLEERYFDAMRYTYALDDSAFHRLAFDLWEWALAARERVPNWPKTVVTQEGKSVRFVQDLVDMWLLEVRQPWRFVRRNNEPDLRRVIMNVSEPIWRRRLSPIYEAIADEFVCWLSIGAGHMRFRLREEVA